MLSFVTYVRVRGSKSGNLISKDTGKALMISGLKHQAEINFLLFSRVDPELNMSENVF